MKLSKQYFKGFTSMALPLIECNSLRSPYPVFVGTNLFHLESFGTFAFCYLTRNLQKKQILVHRNSVVVPLDLEILGL